MTYQQYITKKKINIRAICGPLNLHKGTALPVWDGFITCERGIVCAVTGQNAHDFFWGYDPANTEAEIGRQKLAAELLATAPSEDGDALEDAGNPWGRYGHLEAFPGGWQWVWAETVVELPAFQLKHLLACAKNGTAP